MTGRFDREKARVVLDELGRRARDAYVTLDESHVRTYLDRLAACVSSPEDDREGIRLTFEAGKREALEQLDLDDPRTENAVADAIVRLKGGGFLPLHERYPWRFPQIPPGKCGAHFEPDPERRYTCELLAGHAGWHQETRWHEDLTPQIASWSHVPGV